MTHTYSSQLQLKPSVADAPTDLAAELQRAIQGEVRFDGWTRMLYSTDASLYQVTPIGVVIPKTVEDVQAVVEIAARHRLPILPRGGGSSLAGQAVGAAIVLDFSKYMDQIVAIDAEARTVTAQPGPTVGLLNRKLAAHGLMIGPDPASAERATIGGSIGNNATGSHSILYGMMADNVVSTSVILADGSAAHFAPVDANSLASRGKAETLEGQIYRCVPDLIEQNLAEILARWPKHWRRASGYNLDRLAAALLPPDQRARLSFDSRFRPALCDPQRIDRFNLAQLMTGSEGTLGILTEVTVNLVPRPKRTAVAVVHFERVLDACAAILDILACEPSASELLDKQMMDLARLQPEWARKMNFVEGDPGAVLLTEFYGATEEELVKQIDRLESHLRAHGWRGAIRRILDAAGQAELWAVRKAGLNILGSRRGDFKPIPGIEDVSIPPEHLAEYLGQVMDWCGGQRAIQDVAVYAHASAGCLHVRPLINVKTQAGVEMMQAMADYAVDLCVQYGGVMSGEHGDGYARSALNPRLFGPQLYEALRQVKATFDPQGLLNPGKIVDAPPLTENLRMGPGYQTINLDTVFDWSGDQGFASAVEMCNGAGVCRKLEGVMCPSYMATRDERDTTRGRANALRNVLSGQVSFDAIYSDEMAGVMDLCLGCKACKNECPSSVDMAKIKAEFLVHHYRHNGLPLFNRLMGWLPVLNGLMPSAVVPLVNATLKSSWFKGIQARVGVHPKRTLPTYASTTLERWFAKKQRATDAPTTVMLFHDTWSNFNEPHLGQAAVRVLERAGFTVQLAAGRKCCGRPLITGGQADQAKSWVDHNVALLAPAAAQGIPIVGIEPSCILTLRDEYLGLASDQKRARLLAENTLTFEEFVVRNAKQFEGIFGKESQKALLHGHCHARSLVGNEPSVKALKLAGYQVETIPSGCCGMAGDFGYEIDHYEVSRKIGEDRLLPAVRAAAADTTIVASGFSCRHQIEHFAERQAVHLVEALAARLRQ